MITTLSSRTERFYHETRIQTNHTKHCVYNYYRGRSTTGLRNSDQDILYVQERQIEC